MDIIRSYTYEIKDSGEVPISVKGNFFSKRVDLVGNNNTISSVRCYSSFTAWIINYFSSKSKIVKIWSGGNVYHINKNSLEKHAKEKQLQVETIVKGNIDYLKVTPEDVEL